MRQSTVLCFGTFDGLHTGHEYFLKQARSLGSRLVVSVARDEHIRQLKHREPRSTETDRLAAVKLMPMVDEARLSDQQLGSYEIFQAVQPEIVALGYDQDALRADCQKWIKEHASPIKTQNIDFLKQDKIPIKLI
ncbi:adenylyltransferase/cytidyltransferase family protein [Patescibacteria group bacterium]|nr:adenylyltransferase/cytidyltransferase family protein [Patescibacteria group bacterium]MBU1705328.1 adenylyltransferase/cytidyltransferase family protein [Patescibacteria group bacterium]